MPSRSSSQAREAASLPPRPASNNGDAARHPTHNMLQSAKPQAAAKAVTNIRLGASHDLPSSVTQFLSLSSTSNTAAAKKELRRQLLVLRDYCVDVSNKTKGKELLSQGGKNISKKVEASPDFNSCLDVIFATSLVFTEETEDVAKDTLRSIVSKLKAVQDCGDEKSFRAAIVEVVNRVLLCTPLMPPAKDVKAAAEHEETCAQAKQKAEAAEAGNRGSKRRQQRGGAAPEPRLKDECLDFLTMEDGAPVLLEGRWKRWLNYYEAGYIRYVEKLIEEQRSEQAKEAVSDAEEEGEADADADAAPAAPPVESVPFFTARQSYWKSTTSAYAQFCYLLLAIYFVRTKDFSLNYLARVNKLVQYYAYQLDFADGEPIAVKEGTVEEDDDEEEFEEESEEAEAETKAEAVQGNAAGVQTEQSERPGAQAREEKEKEKEAAAVKSTRSLPPPQYDETVVRRSRPTPLRSARSEHTPSARVAPPEPPKPPRRRTHKCFTTEELPQELRPSAGVVAKEEKEAEVKDTEAHSHVPAVRRTTRMDIAEVSTSRQRDSAEMESAKKATEDARDEGVVEAFAREAGEDEL